MNSLGSSKEIVQNKLIILYLIDRLKLPVSNNTMTRLVLETRLMNYFMFQQCFNELCEGGLLTPSSAGRPGKTAPSADGYLLTASGSNTLQYFMNLIPQGLKKRLDQLISESQKEIRLDSLITADFVPDSENDYTVICKMGEMGIPLMELKAAAGAKKDAREICENWKKHSADIYAEIMEALIKKRD